MFLWRLQLMLHKYRQRQKQLTVFELKLLRQSGKILLTPVSGSQSPCHGTSSGK